MQLERPVYEKGVEGFWGEIIRRTAVGAGAEATGIIGILTLIIRHSLYFLQVVKNSLSEITPRLLKAFGSKEGYRLFDDVLPTR